MAGLSNDIAMEVERQLRTPEALKHFKTEHFPVTLLGEEMAKRRLRFIELPAPQTSPPAWLDNQVSRWSVV